MFIHNPLNCRKYRQLHDTIPVEIPGVLSDADKRKARNAKARVRNAAMRDAADSVGVKRTRYGNWE